MQVKKFFIICLFLAVYFLSMSIHAEAGFDFQDILNNVKKSLGAGGKLSDEKIVKGLKEALEIGTENTVNLLSKADGYYGNPKIRIPLPNPVKKVEKILRSVGLGSKVDSFELSMNRAAEKAAPGAKSLFWETIKGMSFTDAKQILNGRDNEATLYFKDKCLDRLVEVFKPVVRSSMSEVGVTRYLQDFNSKLGSIPFADQLVFDIDQYVTEHALGGLFLVLADEERKIRQDPAARVTDLLKEVFGK